MHVSNKNEKKIFCVHEEKKWERRCYFGNGRGIALFLKLTNDNRLADGNDIHSNCCKLATTKNKILKSSRQQLNWSKAQV